MLTAITAPPRSARNSAVRWLAPSILFVIAMLAGAAIGTGIPGAADAVGPLVDPLILVVITVVFIEVEFGRLRDLRRSPRIVALVLGVNFVVAPLVAVALTSVMVSDDAVRLGVLLYCLFPCTDWFLAFTRTAGGDTRAGAAIIPISLALQLLLFPVYATLLAGEGVPSTVGGIGATLFTWFLIPAGIACVIRLLLRAVLGRERSHHVRSVIGRSTPIVLALMIAALFTANVETLAGQLDLVPIVLIVVATFFVIMGLLGELIARGARLASPERALLIISTTARNAPLMLALTALTLPDYPAITAAIIVGMLLEFPHLTVLTAWIRRTSTRPPAEVAR